MREDDKPEVSGYCVHSDCVYEDDFDCDAILYAGVQCGGSVCLENLQCMHFNSVF